MGYRFRPGSTGICFAKEAEQHAAAVLRGAEAGREGKDGCAAPNHFDGRFYFCRKLAGGVVLLFSTGEPDNMLLEFSFL